MEEILCKGKLILTLESKRDWIRKVPKHLPEKRAAEQRLWIDKNGFCLRSGADFMAAEDIESYPVKVYSLIRVAESIKTK